MGDAHITWSTEEVATFVGCAHATAQKWARERGLSKPGHDYVWSAKNVEDFQRRPKSGRRWAKTAYVGS